MSLDYPGLLRDLKHETDRLVENLGRLTSGDWDLATPPAAGWSVKDQITHLAFFDDATLLALRNPPYEFRVQADAHIADGMDFPRSPSRPVPVAVGRDGTELVHRLPARAARRLRRRRA